MVVWCCVLLVDDYFLVWEVICSGLSVEFFDMLIEEVIDVWVVLFVVCYVVFFLVFLDYWLFDSGGFVGYVCL